MVRNSYKVRRSKSKKISREEDQSAQVQPMDVSSKANTGVQESGNPLNHSGSSANSSVNSDEGGCFLLDDEAQEVSDAESSDVDSDSENDNLAFHSSSALRVPATESSDTSRNLSGSSDMSTCAGVDSDADLSDFVVSDHHVEYESDHKPSPAKKYRRIMYDSDSSDEENACTESCAFNSYTQRMLKASLNAPRETRESSLNRLMQLTIGLKDFYDRKEKADKTPGSAPVPVPPEYSFRFTPEQKAARKLVNDAYDRKIEAIRKHILSGEPNPPVFHPTDLPKARRPGHICPLLVAPEDPCTSGVAHRVPSTPAAALVDTSAPASASDASPVRRSAMSRSRAARRARVAASRMWPVDRLRARRRGLFLS